MLIVDSHSSIFFFMQQLRALDIRFILCDLSVDMKSSCKLFYDLPEGNFELSFWASNYIVIQDD